MNSKLTDIMGNSLARQIDVLALSYYHFREDIDIVITLNDWDNLW